MKLTQSFVAISFAVFSFASIANIESSYQELRWRMIGPFRGGRTRAAVGVTSQPNVFYIGAVNGGVWKSADYGRVWIPIFDDQPTQSIGDIAVAPSDPNIIYVGSGEGLNTRPDLSIGNGIYRSSDAGKTWEHLGLRDGQQIPALAVDPRDSNRVFAAVAGHPYGANEERGIFRSADGGKTWERVLYKGQDTSGIDVAIDPRHPDTIYASLMTSRLGPWEDGYAYNEASGGLFKSTDGGTTWRKLQKGLPENLVAAHAAIAPSLPSRLFVVFTTTQKSEYASGKGNGFYRSDDAGETWYNVTTDERAAMKIGGGDLPVVRVDPRNPDVVYSTGIVTMRSTDGGKTWKSLRGAPGGDDYQNMWINPNDPKIILLVSDQGGVVTVNGGETWSSWYNQPTAQLYHVSVTNSYPYRVCGAQQESGSVCISSSGNDGAITIRDWHSVAAIEYGYVVPDPLDPDIIYGAGRNQVSKYHWSTGQVQNVTPIPILGDKYRVDRTQPIVFSPVDPRVLFTTSNYIFKTTDGGQKWETISPDLARPASPLPTSLGSFAAKDEKAKTKRGAVYSLAPSFKDVDTLWAGTDDGKMWRTQNGGKTWSDITPPQLTPWSKVTQIDVSRHDEQTAYISVSRFRLDDLRPYIYRTQDGGKSWSVISDGLAKNAPVNVIREDPVRKGLLFAGTETDVWVSFDDGIKWQSLQLNLPHTSMRDLLIHGNDLIVATHGRSFWILDDISPLRQINRGEKPSAPRLFSPAVAVLVPRNTNTDTPLPPEEPTGKNPPNGAIVDYTLPKDASNISLEILDSKGGLVRKFTNKDKSEQTKEQLEKQLIPLYWLQEWKSLPATTGMHRWVWDLHHPSPTSTQSGYPVSALPQDTQLGPLGPKVLPGIYTVRLSVDGETFTAQLNVKNDPRVKVTQEALTKKFNLEMRLAEILTASSQMVMLTGALHEQIKDIQKNASSEVKKALTNFEAELDKLKDGAKPHLGDVNDAAVSLYDMSVSADAAPTQALAEAAASTARDFVPVAQQWEKLTRMALPKINSLLSEHRLPELRIDLDLAPRPNGSNEE
jgi:photosystem II stability/assembly factor-like uncharacterized protein